MKLTSDENERVRNCAQLESVKEVKETPCQKTRNDPIKQVTARIDALTSIVDSMIHSTMRHTCQTFQNIFEVKLNSVKCKHTRAPCIMTQPPSYKEKCQPVLRPMPSRTKNETIVNLIGKKTLAQCNLNGLSVSALLVTGAQVSMID